MTCTNCGRTWGQKAEERRKVECVWGILLGLCNGCMRGRKVERAEIVSVETSWSRSCPACHCTWWMADGKIPPRDEGYEDYCGTCHAGHRHWARMMGVAACG